ncbi:MAG: NAD-dependent epimerase/dehydratase family protein [Thermoleophilia bacterium]|nr:NAD-dependent epimerase/dehydratase family protein [Thermoleophilia bacterium]
MRIFLAGATGVVGVRLVPLLLGAGHAVAGMTRSQPDVVAALGAEPVVCDVYDLGALRRAVRGFAPDLVLHQLTDLPNDRSRLQASLEANRRIRSEGTRNLLDAAGGVRMVAQSIAFPPGAPEHERMVLDAGGVVLRYGVFYGPGTYHDEGPPPPPRIHVDEAARRTVELLDAPPGTVLDIVEA